MKTKSGKIKSRKLITAVISLVVCAVLYIFGDYFLGMPEEGGMSVHYIDVGQGDAALIITEEAAVLVDSGTTDSGEMLAAYIKNRIDVIDYMILSHPHEDHIGGASAVFNMVEVKNVIMPNKTADSTSFDRLLEAIEAHDPVMYPAEKGDTYNVGELTLEILSPASDSMYEDTNNVSIVLKVTFGETSFIFTGDAEAIVEEELISDGADLDADVLKVGHHGSSTSTTEEFINAVSPDIAVISCGKDNSYGHPHREILNLFDKLNVEYHRTDRSGNIVISSDGKHVKALKSLYPEF